MEVRLLDGGYPSASTSAHLQYCRTHHRSEFNDHCVWRAFSGLHLIIHLVLLLPWPFLSPCTPSACRTTLESVCALLLRCPPSSPSPALSTPSPGKSCMACQVSSASISPSLMLNYNLLKLSVRSTWLPAESFTCPSKSENLENRLTPGN